MQDQETLATMPAPNEALVALMGPPKIDLALMRPDAPAVVAPDYTDQAEALAGAEERPASPEKGAEDAPAQDAETSPLSGLTPRQMEELADLHAIMTDPARLGEAARYLAEAASKAGVAPDADPAPPLALPAELDQWTDETVEAARWTHGQIAALQAQIKALEAEMRSNLAAVAPVVGDIRIERQAQALSAQIGRQVTASQLRDALKATGIADPALAYRAWAYDRDVRAAHKPEQTTRKPSVPASAPAELDLTDPKLGLAEILAASRGMFEGGR